MRRETTDKQSRGKMRRVTISLALLLASTQANAEFILTSAVSGFECSTYLGMYTSCDDLGQVAYTEGGDKRVYYEPEKTYFESVDRFRNGKCTKSFTKTGGSPIDMATNAWKRSNRKFYDRYGEQLELTELRFSCRKE